MRLSELDNGEMDVTVKSNDGFVSLNYTIIEKEILTEEPYTRHTARIVNPLPIYFSLFCPERNPEDPQWKFHPDNSNDYCGLFYPCFRAHCKSPGYAADVIFADIDREKEIYLGRDWPLPALKQGEAYISEVLAKSAGASKGEYIYFPISLSGFFGREVWKRLSNIQITLEPVIYVPFKIVEIYSDPHGKYSVSQTSVVMIDYDSFIPYLVKHMDINIYTPDVKSLVASLDLRHYASMVIINFPSPRVNAYLQSNYDILQKNVIQFSNTLFYKLGFTQVITDLPVLFGLSTLQFKIIALFLGLILNIIIFILLFLSILLIYSLLMINVETRTFELGVMRMVGTSRRGLIMLLLVQAFSYAIPSWVIGLILAESCTFGLVDILTSFIGIPLDPHLSTNGVLWSTLLGLFVPIMASILPIRDALGKNLHDALDTRKSKVSAVKVKLERADPTQHISWTMVIVGAGIAAFGSIIYYVFPLALLSFNLGLLLNVFFFLLIGMLLGLTILSLNLQPIMERFVLIVFFFWENKAIRSITGKNLIAHRVRNRKTTIMYAISLGFIIFITVAYSLQVQSFQFGQQRKNGSYLKIRSADFNFDSLTVTTLNSYLAKFEHLASTSEDIVNFAWSTHPLESIAQEVTYSEIQNLGEIISFRQTLFSMTPSFYKATLTQFLDVTDSTVDKLQLSEYIYSENGLGATLMSSLYKDLLSLNIGSHYVFGADYGSGNSKYRKSYRFKSLAFMDSTPGFTMSPFPAIMRQDIIVSLTTLFNIVKGTTSITVNTIEDIPLGNFIIKMKDGATDADIDRVVLAFQSLIQGDPTAEVWDFRNIVKPFEVATLAITYFFNGTTIIAMLISFFSLMSSMFTNVYEQTKEIAILRALGISKFSLYRIYIYEAFVLVMSSSLLGVLIGTVVSYTMTLQQLLFTQLPIPFSFPWTIMLTVFGCSVIFSIMAAFSPIYNVLQNRVVQIFRIVT